jgi:hypothetical protein
MWRDCWAKPNFNFHIVDWSNMAGAAKAYQVARRNVASLALAGRAFLFVLTQKGSKKVKTLQTR